MKPMTGGSHIVLLQGVIRWSSPGPPTGVRRRPSAAAENGLAPLGSGGLLEPSAYPSEVVVSG